MATLPDIAPSDGTIPDPIEPQVSRYTFGDSYSQRVGNGINNQQQNWTIVWTLLTAAQRDELQAFFESHGGTEIIDWTPVGESIAKKYTCPSWNFIPKPGLEYYSGTAKMVQEFDL